MNSQYNPEPTLEQKRQMRQMQRLVDQNQRLIDAASRIEVPDVDFPDIDVEVPDVDFPDIDVEVPDVDFPDIDVEVPDVDFPQEAIDAACDAIRAAAPNLVDPIIEEIRHSNLGKLQLDLVDQIRPNTGFIQTDFFDAIKPPSLKQLGFRLPEMPTFKSALPDFRVLPELKATPRLQVPLDLDVQKFTSLTPDLPPAVQLGFEVPKFSDLMPDMPRMNLNMVVPSLEQLGITAWKPQWAVPHERLMSAHSWESVLPRIDLSAYNQVHDIMSMAAATVSAFQERLAPTFRAVHDLSSMIGSLLDGWNWLADIGHRFARFGLMAAMDARAAVLEGEEGKDRVTYFARAWLGIKKITAEVLDAVVAALLDPRWLETDGDVIDNIHYLYRYEHRHTHRPIGETELNGNTIDSLNKLVFQPSGSFAELGDGVEARNCDFSSYSYSDRRTLALLDGLDPIEREIVQVRFASVDTGMTWAKAAQDCGYPEEKGVAVRRKVKRLAKRINPEAS